MSNQASTGKVRPSGRIDKGKSETALKLFKIMALVVGVGLLVLVLEMVLHYGFKNHALDWWPQPHGILFMLYMAAAANLGFKVRWSLGKMVLVILAGCVPFLSFWVERKISREEEAHLASL